MKSNWIKKVKTEICWLTKSENIHALAVIYLMVGATIFGMIWSVNFAIKEDPKYKTKIEKTGYFESITGGRTVTIILTNGELLYASPFVCSHTTDFKRVKFKREVEYGDELHFTIFQEDKMEYIYQLECNGEEYLSYQRGFQLAREQNIFLVFIWIMFFVFSMFLLVAEYLKLRRNKGDIVDIQK